MSLKKICVFACFSILLFGCAFSNAPSDVPTSSISQTANHYLSYYVGDELYLSQKIYSNGLIDLPKNPAKEGYLFSGWYFDEGLWTKGLKEDSFLGVEVESDYSVFAYFKEEEPEKHYLNYYVDGALYDRSELMEGEELSFPSDPEKEDYLFKGWYFDKGSWKNRLSKDSFLSQTILEDSSVYAYFVDDPKSRIGVGVWNGSYHFSVDDNGKQAAQDLRDSGVTTILGLSPYFNSDFSSFADYCEEIGMNLIPSPQPWNKEEGKFDAWDGSIPSWLNKPAVIGVLVQDEPGYNEIASLKEKKDKWDAGENLGKTFFVNLRAASFVYASDEVDYQTYLDEVYASLSPDIISVDSYPLQEDGRIDTYYLKTLDFCSHQAKEKNIPFYMSVCSAKHNSTSGPLMTPTVENLSWQIDLALAYGASGIFHYVYASHDPAYTCMADLHGNKQALYEVMSESNEILHSADRLYTKYEYLGTSALDVGSTSALLKRLEHSVDITSIDGISGVSTEDGDLICGLFQNKKDGRFALRLVNAGKSTGNVSSSGIMASFEMGEIKNIDIAVSKDYVSANLVVKGEKTKKEIIEGALSLSLSSYGSAFVELIK